MSCSRCIYAIVLLLSADVTSAKQRILRAKSSKACYDLDLTDIFPTFSGFASPSTKAPKSTKSPRSTKAPSEQFTCPCVQPETCILATAGFIYGLIGTDTIVGFSEAITELAFLADVALAFRDGFCAQVPGNRIGFTTDGCLYDPQTLELVEINENEFLEDACSSFRRRRLDERKLPANEEPIPYGLACLSLLLGEPLTELPSLPPP